MLEVFRGVLCGLLACSTLSSSVEEAGQAAEVVQPCYEGLSGLTTQVESSLLTCAVSRLNLPQVTSESGTVFLRVLKKSHR